MLNRSHRPTLAPHSPARCHLLIRAVLLLFMTAAQADVYRWTDATGQVHYGDHPPEQAQYERVEVDSPPPSSPASGLRPGEQELLKHTREEERRAAQERRAQAREEARNRQHQAQEDARRHSRCDRYKHRLRRIETTLTGGYSARQSYNLQDRRDEYEAKVKEYCD